MKGVKEQISILLKEAYTIRINNLKQSIELAKEALALSREIDSKTLVAESLNQLSLYYMVTGSYQLSTEMSEEAIRLFEELGDELGIAAAKYNIAGVYYKTDNYHLGIVFLVDALKTYKKYNDWTNESRTEKSLGTIYEYIGDQNNATSSYENAIAAAKKANDANLEANVYSSLSGVLLKQGKTVEALEMSEWSMAIKKRTGDKRGYAFSVYSRGKVRMAKEEYADAEADFTESMHIHKEMGDTLGSGMVLAKLGSLYLKTNRLAEALKIAEEACEYSEKFNMSIIKFKCNYLLYQIHKKADRPLIALRYLEKYQEEKERVINTQTLKVIENYEIIVRMKTLEQEARLQHETAEITEKKNRAEEAVKVRQEFLSVMSHEIRTPLHAITSIVTLLDSRLDEENRKLLDTLRFASNNLIRIVNDILDFSKLDEGKAILELQSVDFKQFCNNIRNTYQGLAGEKGIDLRLESSGELAPAYLFDATKLTQILANLVANAIKFTEKGSVKISIVKLEESKQYDLLRFSINDTGEGIPENFLQEIFESFSQIKPFMTKKQGGTGLGLSIAGRLAELFGSNIQVESTPGQGSVFWFDLSLRRTELPSEFATQNLSKLSGKHILVAEDNSVNAMIILKLLDKLGITADHVADGKLAFEAAKKKLYDCILMDVHMPVMNGLDSAIAIRTMYNLNKKTPIVAVTADIMVSLDDQYTPWFNDFLSKPLETEKMNSALLKIV